MYIKEMEKQNQKHEKYIILLLRLQCGIFRGYLNSIWGHIGLLKRELIVNQLPFVTPGGFKPSTFGTGIQRSIQLN